MAEPETSTPHGQGAAVDAEALAEALIVALPEEAIQVLRPADKAHLITILRPALAAARQQAEARAAGLEWELAAAHEREIKNSEGWVELHVRCGEAESRLREAQEEIARLRAELVCQDCREYRAAFVAKQAAAVAQARRDALWEAAKIECSPCRMDGPPDERGFHDGGSYPCQAWGIVQAIARP